MIEIDFCGFHTHNPNRDIIFRENGTSSYLFLLILSPMTFYFSDRTAEKVKSGACILYTPNILQHYEAEKEFFNSYVHFRCGPEQLGSYDLLYNKIFYPSGVEELNWLLKKIHQEYIGQLTSWEEMVDMYTRQLLICLSREKRQVQAPGEQRQHLYQEFLALRQQILTQCEAEWDIEEMYGILNIGKSQFYKYYQAFFHSTPREELIQARLQKAKYLMNNNSISIKQAAYQSGFENIYHFNRMFKKRFLCTPGEYKKAQGGQKHECGYNEK